MRAICSIAFAGCLATGTLAAADAPPVQLMPGVSEVQWGESTPVPGSAVILLSEQAAPTDRAAAQLLAKYVEKRFGQQWPTHTAKDAPADAKLRVYLGQRQTFPELDRICTKQKLSVPEQQDGYTLKVWARNGTTTAVVAGTNGRGVIYGQDTLFQLFTKQSDKLTVQAATIRDWPTIPLRGRPHPHYQYYLKTDNFDCIMTSRMNFIDLRDGIYAFEPGAKLPKEDLSKIIKEARDRGLRIYAAVNCGVPADKHDAVIGTFKEFIELGADGLWASFDDKGSGAAPKEMVARILALGKEHGISGDAIAVTPPKGDYQTINTKFNREVVSVPGMEQAVWYWTSIPCAEDAADGESIGLRVKPSWWHNWPRQRHPSLSGPGAYVPVISLAVGWNHPNEQELRDMGQHVHAIMPWDGWQAEQYYLVPTLGWWSWRPEHHTFRAVRERIYNVVFGPDQVQTAMAFDDSLNAIQDRFQFWSTNTDYAAHCPPRLKSLNDRDRTRADLQALQGKLAGLRQGAMASSLLNREVLQKEYLDAMAREVETALAEIQAPYPEYWWPDYQSQILNAVYDRDTAKASQLIANVRERLLEDIADVEGVLGKTGMGRGYIEYRLADAITADATTVPVTESTANASTTTGFFIRNSVALRIDDELITYKGVRKEAPFGFLECQRGAFGTKAAAHAVGAKAMHLKECFGLWWRRRADATPADWQELVTKRQAELSERVAEYSKTVAPIKELLSNMDDPPIQVGTGLWEGHNHVLATVLPEPRETFWGDWIGGIYEQGDVRVAAFALGKHLPVNAGVHTELPVNIPVSGRRDRLALIVYLADANKESFGLGRAKWRWSGYRSIRLLWDKQELWKADLGIPRLTGEWFVVPLPPLPADLKTLPLRLRVEDYYSEKNNLEIVYVGPIHLLQLDSE